MKQYDFDKIVDRRGSHDLKNGALAERYGASDLTPMWVADMDFETPDFITAALRRRLEHSLYGYTMELPEYRPAIIDWQRRLHGWEVESEWLTYIPGIVKGIGMAINVFTNPGDKIIIQPPVYHVFKMVVEGNGRVAVDNPLKATADGSQEMDLDGLECIAAGCKMLILSNPHNPAGIVWKPEILRRLAEICERHGVLVISDEIHAEMALWGHKHTPFATVSDAARRNSITFAAPSKTFNIAGIVSSYAIVPEQTIRDKFYGWLTANELNEPTIFSPIATVAAYSDEGDNWRKQMLEYLEGNIDYVINYCKENIPGVRALRPEASFLVWLDCRGLGLDHASLVDLFVNKARLALNDGEMFGKGGEGHMRLNVAMPRSVLAKALAQLSESVKKLKQ
jgi:cystathionine beta-lyase